MKTSETFYVAPGLYFGVTAGVRVMHMNERISDADFHRYLQLMQADIDGRSEGDAMGVLYHVPDAAITQERRIALAKALKSREDKLHKITAIYVLVTSSFLVRGVVRAIWWLAPPAYPCAVASTTQEGFALLAARVPGADATELDRSFQALLAEHAWLLQKDVAQSA